jgi:hypothetical protein
MKIQPSTDLLFTDWLDLKNDVVAHEAKKAAKQVISKQILRGRSNNLRN